MNNNTYAIESPELLKIIKWLSKALSKSVARPALQCIHIVGGKMICSDGRRMHIAPLIRDIWAEGVYKFDGKNLEEVDFPILKGWENISEFKKCEVDDSLDITKEKVTLVSARTGFAYGVSDLQDAIGYGSLFTARGKPCVRIECEKLCGFDDYGTTQCPHPVKITLAGGLVAIVMPIR
jgi:hypothetical protein